MQKIIELIKGGIELEAISDTNAATYGRLTAVYGRLLVGPFEKRLHLHQVALLINRIIRWLEYSDTRDLTVLIEDINLTASLEFNENGKAYINFTASMEFNGDDKAYFNFADGWIWDLSGAKTVDDYIDLLKFQLQRLAAFSVK